MLLLMLLRPESRTVSTRQIAAISLALGGALAALAFGAGWYLAVQSKATLTTGQVPDWLELLLNNLRASLILSSGLVTGSLVTLFVGSFSLFFTGASFGAAVLAYGLVPVLTAGPHIPFELAGLVMASGIGLSPLPLAWFLLSGRDLPPRRNLVRLAAYSFLAMFTFFVTASWVEVEFAFPLADRLGP